LQQDSQHSGCIIASDGESNTSTFLFGFELYIPIIGTIHDVMTVLQVLSLGKQHTNVFPHLTQAGSF
jgi:hypothetical protein